MGPQGCGKSTLAKFIVDGMKAAGVRATTVDAEWSLDMTSADIKREMQAFEVVVVEAEPYDPRPAHLLGGDETWHFWHRG